MLSNKVIIAAAAAACTMFLLLAAAADEQPPLGGSPPASHDSAAGTAALTVHGGKPPLRDVGGSMTNNPSRPLGCPQGTRFPSCGDNGYYACTPCSPPDRCTWKVVGGPDSQSIPAFCQKMS